MKWRDLKAVPWRIKVLVTRETTWVNQQDGSTESEKETFSSAWAIVGVHSWQWWWVKKWGRLPCGCTRNPLTRRMVLYDWDCPETMARMNREESSGSSDK